MTVKYRAGSRLKSDAVIKHRVFDELYDNVRHYDIGDQGNLACKATQRKEMKAGKRRGDSMVRAERER